MMLSLKSETGMSMPGLLATYEERGKRTKIIVVPMCRSR